MVEVLNVLVCGECNSGKTTLIEHWGFGKHTSKRELVEGEHLIRVDEEAAHLSCSWAKY